MADLKAFRTTNNLFQKDLSEFLGVSIGFISAVERGSSKLPAEHIAKLLSNPNGWDTRYLTEEYGGARIHNDYRQMTVGSNTESCEYNGTVNNFNGLSEEEIQKRVDEKTALIRSELQRLEGENGMLRDEIAYLRSVNRQLITAVTKKPEEEDSE